MNQDGNEDGPVELINRGVGTSFGELGDFLGDSDIGQVRYFNSPTEIWEFLGFDRNNYLNDDVYPRYSNRQEINDHLDVIQDNLDDIKEVVNKWASQFL